MTDRAASETLGFVLVFSLIVATIGIVYASGISGLNDAQQAEKVENVGRAFDVLADNLEDLHRRGAPSRATEVKLAGGSLHSGQPVTIEVSAKSDTNASRNTTYSIATEPIVYRDQDGTALVYSSGAVLREDPGGTAMLGEPAWLTHPNRSALPLVNTYGTDRGGIAGEGTVLIVAERGSRKLGDPFRVGSGSVALVNVTVNSPRAGAWKRFFESREFEPIDADATNGNVTYRFETRSLYVSTTGIEVTFER